MPHLSSQHVSSKLTLPAWVGQRSATFQFDVVDAVTGYRRTLNPVRDSQPVLRHNTTGTIKRTLTQVGLGVADTAVFNSISSRLELFMIISGESFPLGRYVPSDWPRFRSTGGTTSVASFYDEGFIVDQQVTNGFGALTTTSELCSAMLDRFLSRYPITFEIAPSDFSTLDSWNAGTRGGVIVEQLALDGDYLAPWFDHESIMQFIRNFDPADEIPTFNFDRDKRVLRENIVESDNLIDAPNRFVVIGNGAASVDNGSAIVGSADVPSSAPHSIANRGFIVPEVVTRQIQSSAQAGAIAANLAQRNMLFEQTELETPPDPRHDSYDVIRWQGENWLEIGWTLTCHEGAPMRHTLRKTYRS